MLWEFRNEFLELDLFERRYDGKLISLTQNKVTKGPRSLINIEW